MSQNESSIELKDLNDSNLELDRLHQHPETDRKELCGWYLFEFGMHPFSSAALITFIPLILEEIAIKAGTSDFHNPHHPPCLEDSGDCFIRFGALWVTPVSFSLYVTSISVFLQVLSFISFGSFADYEKYRKILLITFSTICSVMCLLFLAVFPQWYELAAVLTIIANVAFGTAYVFYNAYLPLLVNASPEVRVMELSIEEKEEYEIKTPTFQPEDVLDSQSDQLADHDSLFEPLEQAQPITTSRNSEQYSILTLEDNHQFTKQDLLNLKEIIGNRISTHGFTIAFIGGVLVLILCALIILFISSQLYFLQICVAFCGLWSLLFILGFTLPWLKTRPGPPLPTKGLALLGLGWKKTYKTIRHCVQLKNLFLYLLAWFFYSDGISTTATVAVLFGKSELQMTNAQLMLIAIVGPLAALPGNYFFLYLSKKMNWSSKRMVLLLIALNLLLPLWCLLGFIPHFSLGAKSSTEMICLGAFYGFMVGAIQSFSRVFFSEMIPAGMESELFALFEITDRGSSWLGPLLVGICAEGFGNVRYGFYILIILLVVPIPLLLYIDSDKGKQEAKAFHVKEVE